MNITFDLATVMTFSDSVPFNRGIRMAIWKSYCNGTQSGHFEPNGTPGLNGYWHPPMTYSYKFENDLDRVTVTFYAQGPDGQYERMEWQEFYYNGVFNTRTVSKTFYITVPWASTD